MSTPPSTPTPPTEPSIAPRAPRAARARPGLVVGAAALVGVAALAHVQARGGTALAAAPPAAPADGEAAGEPKSGESDGEGEGKAPGKPKPPPGISRVKVQERDGMLLLPGGRFPMGTNNPKAPPNERPQRVVTVGAFWLDRTEVTVGAYRACVEAKRCERPQVQSMSCTYDLGDAELPVSCVRWSDAEAFCKSAQKRLPKEAEWEFAARGPEGYAYPWGNRSPDCKLANTLIRETSGRACQGRPWRVGTAPANASKHGVLDLGGNVEEWTADWYTERVGALAPLAGASHTLRGGGWQSTPGRSRGSTRDWGSALESGPNVGFRCARDASTVSPAPPRPARKPAPAGTPP